MTRIDTSTPTISREVGAPAGRVWDVLSDGWLYPLWVVGAARMRAVDGHWPAAGARLHHSVGSWPLLVDDLTEVLDVVPGQSLRLRAHAWPTGAAEVLISVEGHGGTATVSIQEDAVEGPAVAVPKAVRQLGIAARNREALRRLAFLAEGR